jgi:molybdopterin molybdotransferase
MEDVPPDGLVSVDDAIAVIDAVRIDPVVSIEVDLSRLEEQLTTNVLAQDVFADRDYPPFDKALMDGYAVRAADVSSLPTRLAVAGEVAAGGVSFRPLQADEALAIMTGAPVPLGADAVVPVEHTRPEGAEAVWIDKPVKPGQSIARAGTDLKARTLVLPGGTPIGPAQLAALASVGQTSVRVVGDPISHVLVTGDEIVHAGVEPTGSQIRDANGPAMVALLKHFSTLPGLSHVKDNPQTLRAAIDQIACEADVLLICGGMSMGRHDHVPGVLRELGFEFLITKLRIKPGKPFVFAIRRRPEKTDYVFGLPGNPVSGFVCTLRLVSRLIARLRGLRPQDHWLHAKLAAPLPANGPREFYQPAILGPCGCVTPLDWKGSADVFTLARADVLIRRSADEGPRVTGDPVRAIAIPR